MSNETLAKLTSATKAATPMYRTHSAPGSFVFADGTRQICHDGIVRASNEVHAAELEAAAEVGNIFRVSEEEAAAIAAGVAQEASSNLAGIK